MTFYANISIIYCDIIKFITLIFEVFYFNALIRI